MADIRDYQTHNRASLAHVSVCLLQRSKRQVA